MSKTLVTHINPHLDDIAAIWLYKKIYPEFKDASLEFVSATNDKLENTEDKVYVGVGRGEFDEHKGDTEDCATSLVYKHGMKAAPLVPAVKEAEGSTLTPADVEGKAVEELVEWVRQDDLGRLEIRDYPEFSIPAWIRSTDSNIESSKKTVELGIEILERILRVLKRKYLAEKEWEGSVEFETKFGKSFAIMGKAIDRSFCRDKGGDLFVMYDPNSKWTQYFTPSFEIDLEPIYNKVKELDPQADWFLHQSHHMVICGSNSSPESKVTKLSFEELIKAAKEV